MGSRNPSFVIDHSQRNDPTYQEAPEAGFNDGPTPHGIYRRFEAANRGLIGNDMSTWPTERSDIRIPHRLNPKMGPGRASNAGIPSSDETASIPGWAIGDPR